MAIVLSTHESGQQSKHAEDKGALKDEEECVKCHICNFKARGEWTNHEH